MTSNNLPNSGREIRTWPIPWNWLEIKFRNWLFFLIIIIKNISMEIAWHFHGIEFRNSISKPILWNVILERIFLEVKFHGIQFHNALSELKHNSCYFQRKNYTCLLWLLPFLLLPLWSIKNIIVFVFLVMNVFSHRTYCLFLNTSIWLAFEMMMIIIKIRMRIIIIMMIMIIIWIIIIIVRSHNL